MRFSSRSGIANYIDNVQITMAESFGVEGRGAFYDEVGAIRDVLQNHLLQVAALLAMEAPSAGNAASSSEEKVRVFRAMRPIDPKDVVRGQFRGYRDTKGVGANSDVETFVALRMYIDNPRWSGVPFYIRAGKELPVTATEVMVDMKAPPIDLRRCRTTGESNYFRFRLGPEVVIAEGARVKTPGETMRGEPVELVARHHAVRNKAPYERLLGDAMRGDNTLFISDECVEAAWTRRRPCARPRNAGHRLRARQLGSERSRADHHRRRLARSDARGEQSLLNSADRAEAVEPNRKWSPS